MSAPTITRSTAPVREGAPRRTTVPRIPSQRTSQRPSQRTAERITERLSTRERARAVSRQRDRVHAGRAKFVLVVMTLLVIGLVATLWLSTAAAADSYRLQEARTRAGSLTEQSEQLRKQVSAMNSPSALAQRATAQGLVPVQDPARLVVAPDGRVDVVGEPTAAQAGGPTPPSVPAAPAPAAPATPAPQAPAATASPARADTADPAAAAGATIAGGQG